MSRLARVVQQYWIAQFADLQTLPAAVSAGEPDAIHDLRAAGRRIKSTLRIFQPLVRGPVARVVLNELDWYNHFLGEARDSQVIFAEASGLLTGREGTEQLLAALAAEQHRTLLRAERLLADERTTALLESVQELVTEPWRSGRHGKDAGGSALLERLAWATGRFEAVWRSGPGQGESRGDWQHRVRRRAKAARYGNEALSSAFPELGDVAAGYAQVATLLGTVQDTAVLNRALVVWPATLVAEAMASRARLAGEAERMVGEAIHRVLELSAAGRLGVSGGRYS